MVQGGGKFGFHAIERLAKGLTRYLPIADGDKGGEITCYKIDFWMTIRSIKRRYIKGNILAPAPPGEHLRVAG